MKDVERRLNREKVLVIANRGISSRYRYLMKDLIQLLPHSKKGNCRYVPM
jgi:hypothetical protein